MPSSPRDNEPTQRTTENLLVEALRVNMMEMTAALSTIEVDDVEVELPYRAAWTGTEAAQ